MINRNPASALALLAIAALALAPVACGEAESGGAPETSSQATPFLLAELPQVDEDDLLTPARIQAGFIMEEDTQYVVRGRVHETSNDLYTLVLTDCDEDCEIAASLVCDDDG